MISSMRSRIPLPEDRPWRVLGLMSGTSADGVDVVAVEVDPAGFPDGRPLRALLGHHATPYPEALKTAVLAAASNRLDPAGLCVLQRRLGDHHAHAAAELCASLGLQPDLASLHGQTVQHHPAEGASLQLADPYVLAEVLGCPVVWDLRRRDLALGGQGAPLVPLPERWLRGAEPWLALNLGGIANLAYWDGPACRPGTRAPACPSWTWPPGAGWGRPSIPGVPRPRAASTATCWSAGCEHPYFRQAPPKSTGREVFGEAWLEAEADLLEALPLPDRLATLAAFSAEAVAREAARLDPLAPGTRGLVSGGGARHRAPPRRAGRAPAAPPGGRHGVPARGPGGRELGPARRGQRPGPAGEPP